jgi:hypothetical protein
MMKEVKKMKCIATKLTILCVAFTFICLFADRGDAKIDSKTIVGIWLMDEGSGNTVKDTSLSGNDGKIQGNVKWTKGKFDNALDFPGGGMHCVSIPHKDSLNLVTWTATAWVKMEPGDWQGILVKATAPGAGARNYGIWTWITSGELWAQSHFPEAVTAQGKTVITNGQWFHVAGSYDGKAVRAYVNGELEKEVAGSGNPVTNTAPLSIGAGTAAGDFPMKGIVDDAGLFNAALAVDDIKTIMKEGLGKTLGLTPIEPNGQLAAAWGAIKSKF